MITMNIGIFSFNSPPKNKSILRMFARITKPFAKSNMARVGYRYVATWGDQPVKKKTY